MNGLVKRFALSLGAMVLGSSALVAFSAPAADEKGPSGQAFKIDGSSTVYPITKATLEAYHKIHHKRAVGIDLAPSPSGTGGGFKKFCGGETLINDASRPISDKELAQCRKNKIAFLELPIAFDALTIVVHPKNDWAKTVSIADLKKMWEPGAQGKIKRWNQVRSDWPNQPLNLYGPGTDSGTYDYFAEALDIEGTRRDFTASEDDDFLVAKVSGDSNSLGYFGYAYYLKKQDKLKAIAVAGPKGPVLPSPQNLAGGTYQPFSRPLFIYVNAREAQTNPALRKFVEFYLAQAPKLVGNVGYVPLPAEGYHLTTVRFHGGRVGTLFEGKPVLNLTIRELLSLQNYGKF